MGNMGNMDKETDVLVVGGGPGGLACATVLAQHNCRVVLIEAKPVIGPKVCAGGITWNGLVQHLPAQLIEQAFPKQHIHTPWQRVMIEEKNPIIATVNRQRLGQWMAAQAQSAGVRIFTGTRVRTLANNQAVLEHADGKRCQLRFHQLVGADGSNSLVRRFLGLPTTALGIGLNCMMPGQFEQMEWHLAPKLFGSGYGWCFPHQGQCSIGVYADLRVLTARILKQRLLLWAAQRKIEIAPGAIRAGLVNYDYRGVCFGSTWLVGDAAGLASGLTGEGIYSALVSGQEVARMIVDTQHKAKQLDALVRRHARHRRLAERAVAHPRACLPLMETLVFLLRLKIIAFRCLEMAD